MNALICKAENNFRNSLETLHYKSETGSRLPDVIKPLKRCSQSATKYATIYAHA